MFQSDVELDYSKISIIGHSFGGTTALYTTIYDKRITGVCIGLDPCVYIFRNLDDLNAFPKPLLCINSENFYKKIYPWFFNDEILENVFKNMN